MLVRRTGKQKVRNDDNTLEEGDGLLHKYTKQEIRQSPILRSGPIISGLPQDATKGELQPM